ncbi:hypothetical protein HK105_203757 [Polyrhizophydium stewartii]|uniref:ABC transporter domain-containing protein n=1 Tax=Polyrhizophydium stewartii TaxID=2732419 RepID=A0ABR4NAT7_9FUNG|nr:hypothetical protein HK105_001418 [Polyrhizophydium stewartii]
MPPPKKLAEAPLYPDLPCFFSNITTGIPLAPQPVCQPGYYCPNVDPNNPLTVPTECPASPACRIERLSLGRCGPQGKYEPTICDPGHFCPTPREMYPCPAGNYCPSGTVVPNKCDFFSICPEGTIIQRSYTGFVICGILDVALAVLFLAVRLRELKMSNSSWTELLPPPLRKFMYEWSDKRAKLARSASKRSAKSRASKSNDNDVKADEAKAVEMAQAKDQRKNFDEHESQGEPKSDTKPSQDTATGEGNAADEEIKVNVAPAQAEIIEDSDAIEADQEHEAEDSIKQENPSPAVVENETIVDISRLTSVWNRGLGGHNLSVDFKFSEMGLQLPSGKYILKGVTGEIKSSRMTAIMGPSGAGKTTFMNVLCGKVSRTKGDLFVNGKRAEIPDYKKIMGYVPQDDVMLRELTVREIVLHSARCRLPRSWPAAEIEKYVDDLLVALNLAHVAHTVIGDETTRGVSGGQRKRVNIAIEMAAVPICLFLDEPTSGLDSTAALDVANILQQITQLGMTIVAVIHQPRIEIFRKFDDVLMIAPGGRTAYLGPTAGARPYFERLGFVFDPLANEADVLMDILAGKGHNTNGKTTPEDLIHMWNQHITLLNGGSSSSSATIHNNSHVPEPKAADVDTEEARHAADADADANDGKGNKITLVHSSAADADFDATIRTIVSERGASMLRQIVLCHNRSLVQQMRMVSTLALETLVGMIAGLLMGISANSADELYTGVYIQPYTSLSPAPLVFAAPLLGLLIGLSIALASGSPGVMVFSEEKTVYWREAAAGHSRVGYYVGKTLSTVYRIVLSSLHFTALFYFLSRPLMPFDHEFVVVFLSFFGVYGAAAIVSMVVRRENAGLLSVVANLFAGVFCGYGPTLADAKNWNLLFIWELSFNKWGAEAMFSDSIWPYRDVYMIDLTAKTFGYTMNRFSVDVAMMFAIGVAWRIIAFVLMIVMNRDKQR